MSIHDILARRSLPSILTDDGRTVRTQEELANARDRIKRTLEEYAYGRMPKTPDRVDFTVTGEEDRACAGKVTLTHMQANITMGDKHFSFPFFAAVPKHAKKPVPALVYIRFFAPIADKYLPLEEITDRGYAVFTFNYQDVTSDDGDFENGIAPYLCHDRTAPDAPGKIAMWAWAASRVLDYVMTRDDIDLFHVAVIGHSRLGKTALLAGGYDERFRYVISNDSGCMGAAITRKKIGETYQDIAKVFPFWFCPRFVSLKDTPTEELPYDQHFLLALTPPRSLLVGSAEEDEWADPASEFLTLYKTNELYSLFGMRGLIAPESIPKAPFVSDTAGDASYHLRHGSHFMSREDFNIYLDYIDSKR